MDTHGAAPEGPARADRVAHSKQFALLSQRRFVPFFWAQFLGAGNDNLFKFAFTVLVTYQIQVSWLPPGLAGLAIGALFILPFLLFSATSGQLRPADVLALRCGAGCAGRSRRGSCVRRAMRSFSDVRGCRAFATLLHHRSRS